MYDRPIYLSYLGVSLNGVKSCKDFYESLSSQYNNLFKIVMVLKTITVDLLLFNLQERVTVRVDNRNIG